MGVGGVEVRSDCPNHHRMEWSKTTTDNFICGVCKKEFRSTGVGERIGCAQCRYQVCSLCCKDNRVRDIQIGGFEEGKKPGYIVVAKRDTKEGGKCEKSEAMRKAECDAEYTQTMEKWKVEEMKKDAIKEYEHKEDEKKKAALKKYEEKTVKAGAMNPEGAAKEAPEMKTEECAGPKK